MQGNPPLEQRKLVAGIQSEKGKYILVILNKNMLGTENSETFTEWLINFLHKGRS